MSACIWRTKFKYSLYKCLKSVSSIYALLMAICKQATTSMAERFAITRNLLNSASVCNVEPSAIFSPTESAARFIWEDKLYSSCFGKDKAVLSISFDKSNAICQTFNFSNLKDIGCCFSDDWRLASADYLFIPASISSTVMGIPSNRSMLPPSVIHTLFSMRMPMSSSSI